MKSFYILFIAIVVSAVSCRTKEGAPGPAGESNLTQQGSVTGTLAYVDYQGNPISVPFSYSYYESASDNKFYYDVNGKKNYQIEFFRRDLKDYNNYINFSNLYGFNVNNQFNSPSGGIFQFSLVKIIDNNLFEFSGYFNSSNQNSTYVITNYSFDATTGRLIFDFVLTFDALSIDSSTRYNRTQAATLTGRVDVILNRTQVYTTPPL